MNCTGLINAGIGSDCKLPTKGYEREGVIINRDDIDFGSLADPTNNTYATMPLKSGKTGFKIIQLGDQPFEGTKSSLRKGTYGNGFDHILQIVVLDNTPAVSHDIIDALASGEFVVILECKDKGGSSKNGAFKVYGIEVGLKAETMENDAYSEAAGGWIVTLKEEANSSACYLFATSYAATKTLVEGLLPSASSSSDAQ